MKIVAVNVKELIPPEPMTAILAALAALDKAHCLLVTHRRQPFPLYEKLVQAGWAYYCDVHDDDDISLYIYRQDERLLFDKYLAEQPVDDKLLKQ